jgi:hypothetical protein
MSRLLKSFIVGTILSMVAAPPLHAQSAPAEAKATPTAPTGQAPDDMTKKITDLVHTGKYAEAQKLTEGLLIAYPDDQRLLKAKALIENLLAPGGSSSAAPGSSQPAQPTANTNTEQLTGMDKVDYNALIELARQAQQNADLEQQKASLKQFMDESGPFLQKHPTELLLWQLRAASAISLNDPIAGHDAGQELLAMGAAGSSDSNLQRLLAQLKNKGWLGKEWAERIRKQADITNKYGWMLGTWTISFTSTSTYLSNNKWRNDSRKSHGDVEIEFSKFAPVVEVYWIGLAGVKSAEPTYRGTRLDSGEIHWEYVDKNEWYQVRSSQIDEHKRTMTLIVPSWLNQRDEDDPVPITYLFTRNDSAQ